MTMAAPFNFSIDGDPPGDLMEVSTDANRDIHANDDIDIDIDFEGGGLAGNEDEHMGEGEGEGSVSLRDDAEMIDETPMPEDEIIEDAVQLDNEHDATYFAGDQELHDLEDLEGQNAVHATDSVFYFDEPKDIQTEAQAEAFTDTEAQAHIDGPGVETSIKNEDKSFQEYSKEPQPHDAVEEDFAGTVASGGNDLPTSGRTVTEEDLSNVAKDLKATAEARLVQEFEQSDQRESAEPEEVEEPEVPGDSINEEDDIENEEDKEDESSTNLDALTESKPEPDPKVVDHRDQSPEAHSEDSPSSAAHPEKKPATDVEETDTVYPTALVTYQENEMSLFPPLHGDDEAQTYLLTDESLAKGPLRTMLRSCKMVLGDDIPESEELELVVPSLGLSYLESHSSSSEVVLTDLIDLYTQLQRNDGVNEPEPIKVLLQTRVRMSKRLESLYDARNNGQGLSSVSTHLQNSFYITGLPDDPFDFNDGKDFVVPPDVAPGQSHNLAETSEQEHYQAGSTPQAHKEDWLAGGLGVDDFDFSSPHRTQKNTRGAAEEDDVGQGLENNTVTLEESTFEITESYDDFDTTQHETEESSFALFDDAKDVAFEKGHDVGQEANTYSGEDNKDSREQEDTAPLDETYGRADYTEPPLPPEVEDDLDDFGDTGDLQDVEHSGEISPSTILGNQANASFVQNDQQGKNQVNDVVAEDEITYEDEDEIEDYPTNGTYTESNSKAIPLDSPASSLKRQRSATEGDEDNFNSSRQPQPDQKRIRGDEEA